MEISVNWLAVLVAAVVSFLAGWIWYGLLFGKTWQSLMGFTPESMANMKMKPVNAMIGGFITSIVMVYVLYHIMILSQAFFGDSALETGLWSAFFVWLGFLATTSLGSYLWEGKPFKLFMLNAGEQLVAVALAGITLSFWF